MSNDNDNVLHTSSSSSLAAPAAAESAIAANVEDDDDDLNFLQEDVAGDADLAHSHVGGEGLDITRDFYSSATHAKRKRGVLDGAGQRHHSTDGSDDDDVEGIGEDAQLITSGESQQEDEREEEEAPASSRYTLGDVHPSVLLRQLQQAKEAVAASPGGSSTGSAPREEGSSSSAPDAGESSSSSSSSSDDEVATMERFNAAVLVDNMHSTTGADEENDDVGIQPHRRGSPARPLLPPHIVSMGLSGDLAADAALAAGDVKIKMKKRVKRRHVEADSSSSCNDGYQSEREDCTQHEGRFTRDSSVASTIAPLPAYELDLDGAVVNERASSSDSMGMGSGSDSTVIASHGSASPTNMSRDLPPNPWKALHERAHELAGKKKRAIVWADADTALPASNKKQPIGGGVQVKLTEHRYVGPNAQIIRMRREEAQRQEELRKLRTQQELKRRKELANQVLDSTTGMVYRVVNADEFDRNLLLLGRDAAVATETPSAAAATGSFPVWEHLAPSTTAEHEDDVVVWDEEDNLATSAATKQQEQHRVSFFDMIAARLRELSVVDKKMAIEMDEGRDEDAKNGSFQTPKKMEQQTSGVKQSPTHSSNNNNNNSNVVVGAAPKVVTLPKASSAGFVELNAGWMISAPPMPDDDGGDSGAVVVNSIHVPL